MKKTIKKSGWIVIEDFNGHEIFSDLYETKADAEYRSTFWSRVHRGIKNKVAECEMTYTYEI